jgi:hypothetical protein
VLGPPRISQQDVGAMAEMGISPMQLVQPKTQALALWPENQTPVMLFEAMLSQWRMGFKGPVGLDYAALPVVSKLLGIGARELRGAFSGVRVMEAEVMRAIATFNR